MTKQIKSKGFTIVELLIVIVVIAILAAITIVAYNGIQSRAHTTAQKTSAENLAKKVEAFNAIKSVYPTLAATTDLNTNSGDASTSLTGSGITLGTAQAGNPDGTVELDLCSTSTTALAASTAAAGYVVYVWDSTKTTPAKVPVQAGGNVSIDSTGAVTPTSATINCSAKAS